MNILVTGATGTVGSAIVELLSGKGLTFWGAGRSAAQAPGRRVLDFAKPATFRKALEGITHVFLMAPPGVKNPAYYKRFLDAALSFQVRHITMLSGRTSGDVSGRALNLIEEQVRSSGIAYTILRPGWFMQNFSGDLAADIRDEGRIYLPAGNSRTAFVDVRDIAEAVVQTFLDPSHQGKTYELVSREALDHYQVAALFTQALGRPVEYVPLSPAAYISRMLERGKSESHAALYVYLYDLVKTGKEALLSGDLERIIGREPVRFERFIEDHLETWKLNQ